MCAHIKTGVCGSPALGNWDRIFIQPRPDLDSITSGPMDRVDRGLHHCLTLCMLQIDFLVPMEGGKWMWKGGTWLYTTRKEVEKSVEFGPCAVLCISLLLLRTTYLDLPNTLSIRLCTFRLTPCQEFINNYPSSTFFFSSNHSVLSGWLLW